MSSRFSLTILKTVKTCGKYIANIRRVFLSVVRILSENFLLSDNFSYVPRPTEIHAGSFVKFLVFLSDFNKIKEKKTESVTVMKLDHSYLV